MHAMYQVYQDIREIVTMVENFAQFDSFEQPAPRKTLMGLGLGDSPKSLVILGGQPATIKLKPS